MTDSKNRDGVYYSLDYDMIVEIIGDRLYFGNYVIISNGNRENHCSNVHVWNFEELGNTVCLERYKETLND